VSPTAEKQLADLGLKVETLVHRTDRKLVSYVRLVVAFRNTSDRAYDRLALTMVVLDKDRNETGVSQTVDLQDVVPGVVTQVVVRARYGDLHGSNYQVAKVEVFQKVH
jgi:hypothetical protein